MATRQPHGLPERPELLLAELDLVCDLPGVHDELGLHLDEVLVVGELLGAEVAVQEAGDGGRPAVDALLQRLGLVQLRRQLRPLRLQEFLKREMLRLRNGMKLKMILI